MGRRVDTSLNVKVKVELGDGEPIESALRRFKREVNKSGRKLLRLVLVRPFVPCLLNNFYLFIDIFAHHQQT